MRLRSMGCQSRVPPTQPKNLRMLKRKKIYHCCLFVSQCGMSECPSKETQRKALQETRGALLSPQGHMCVGVVSESAHTKTHFLNDVYCVKTLSLKLNCHTPTHKRESSERKRDISTRSLTHKSTQYVHCLCTCFSFRSHMQPLLCGGHETKPVTHTLFLPFLMFVCFSTIFLMFVGLAFDLFCCSFCFSI